MLVRWLTLFIDRPEETFPIATDFWQRTTGTTRSAPRGDHHQFATLLPQQGDAHIRVQRVDSGAGGTHLDVHTDDSARLINRAVGLGATVVDTTLVPVLLSPGGYTWCIVSWHGEATPAPPFVGPTGAPSRLDQICLDIAPDHFETEVQFWSQLLGTPASTSTTRPEFASIARDDDLPLRLLFQRLDDGDGPTTGHLDVAAGERIGDVVAEHVAAGAEVETREWPWTVLRDPSGHRYCVTPRDPATKVSGYTRRSDDNT